MSNYPDGWNRDDEILAGIAEEHPGFESHFDSLLGEMTEEEYEAADLDALREQALENWLWENQTAKADDDYYREQEHDGWDGPW